MQVIRQEIPAIRASASLCFGACLTLGLIAASAAMADSQFSRKAIATLQSCSEAPISGFATLKERASDEGVKEIEVFLQVEGLGNSQRAVHIHETASCEPCGSAGGHYDPGNSGESNPDANHPFHAGDLINIKSRGNIGTVNTVTSRVTLASGPLSVFDDDGSAFIVHDNPDSYCQGGEVAGCAGGSRAACGIITPIQTSDNYDLQVSTTSQRQRPTELSGAELADSAYVFLTPTYPNEAVASVDFFIDGRLVRTETAAPYDLAGTRNGGEAGRFDTERQLNDGRYTLSAVINLTSGETSYVSSVFSVDNDNQRFLNGNENRGNHGNH